MPKEIKANMIYKIYNLACIREPAIKSPVLSLTRKSVKQGVILT